MPRRPGRLMPINNSARIVLPRSQIIFATMAHHEEAPPGSLPVVPPTIQTAWTRLRKTPAPLTLAQVTVAEEANRAENSS
jgi:hypothetical protein